MFKKMMASIGILVTVSSIHALSISDRYTRMTTDTILTRTMQGVEEKYRVSCRFPDENQVKWRCLNGPQCGYTFTVTCTNDDLGGEEIVVSGFDDGKVNNMFEMKLNRLR